MLNDANNSVTIAPRRSGPGLDKIVRGAPPAASYGRTENLSPADLQVISALDQLFEMPDIGDFIMQSLMPELGDASLLQPRHFAKALLAALDQLRSAADADPALAQKLGRCAGLMQQVKELHELLQSYTNALLQG